MISTGVNVEQTKSKDCDNKDCDNKGCDNKGCDIISNDSDEYNKILDRNNEIENLKSWLLDFEINKNEKNIQRGVYIYGAPGSGKTYFVKQLLKSLNYDIINYDAGDIRNKNVIENITKQNMSSVNVLSMFKRENKKICVIMDEIDGMNNGDKGGINTLIKLIRPKKTKKQKLEEYTLCPIICIGSYHIDKKIRELMKVCFTIELKRPKNFQIREILQKKLKLSSKTNIDLLVKNINGDLHKVNNLLTIIEKNTDRYLINNIDNHKLINVICSAKNYNEDTKNITKNILNNNYSIDQHNSIMNETDRTIVGLLWHENVIDILSNINGKLSLKIYKKILKNICFSDYIDRVTFQKQIWQLNEMSSILKTFYNNHILHYHMNKHKIDVLFNPSEIRFTKVLTKYSTEYNNQLFINFLCTELMMDISDLFVFFIFLKKTLSEDEIRNFFENYNINKLDIDRMIRLISKLIDMNFENDMVNDE